MTSLGQFRDMYKMQREAKRIRKELARVHVEAEGKWCKVIVNGEQEIVSIELREGSSYQELGEDVKDAFNRAMKKAQLVASERMQGLMKQMGMPTEEGMPADAA